MSVLSTIGSILGAPSTISTDVATAERDAAIGYFIIAFELALVILGLAFIARKLRK